MPSRPKHFWSLTARICGFFYLSNSKVMKEEQKSQLIAEAENVEAIRDFFTQWWSAEQLFETAAKCSINLLALINRGAICEEERKDFEKFVEQHMMMIDLLTKFRKEEEV